MEGPAEEWRRIGRYEQHRQQQQQQQHRQQQHQQRQEMFRQHQQLQQHQQYYFQQPQYHSQQHQETLRRQMRAREIARMWASQHQQETTKKTSEAQVEAQADREEAQAEISSALPSSQTTLKPQSLSEYSAMLSVPQPASFSEGINSEDWSVQDAELENMENGMLLKPAQKQEQEQEELARICVETERPPQPMQAAQPRPCPPVEGAGGDEMGDRGEEQVVASCEARVEEQRAPFWEDSDDSVWWPVPDETEQEMESLIARLIFSFGVNGGCGSGGLSGGIGFWKGCKESSGMGDEESNTKDGGDCKRAGVGTGWSYSSILAGWRREPAGRRLTRQRRARVREK